MSALWTHKEAAQATGGRAVGEWAINGLSIDTRSIKANDLFVPLKDIRDGHDFIPMAYEKGAGAVLSEHEIKDTPALIVKDSLKALEGLAIAARKRSKATRIAITGSVGKTSVKEMVAHICRAAGKTHNSIKSFNNHWGVPLTLAGMPQDTKYGVFEMGMNHAGELAELTEIVAPNIAAITKIAPAHLAHFKNVDAIAEAKAEILFGLATDGVAILPRDSEYYSMLAKRAKNSASFGWHEDANARIMETRATPKGSQFILRIAGRNMDVELPLHGKHWVENAACALLITHRAKIDLDIAVNTLKNMYKIKGRGEVHTLNINGCEVTLIDESYNANPASMGAAIATLGLNQGRTIAVLGDMLELGDTQKQLHVGLANPLFDNNITQVLTCGTRMKALHKALPNSVNSKWFEDHNSCLEALTKTAKDGDTIMIKGSNASGMSKIVTTLLANNNKDKKHVL